MIAQDGEVVVTLMRQDTGAFVQTVVDLRHVTDAATMMMRYYTPMTMHLFQSERDAAKQAQNSAGGAA